MRSGGEYFTEPAEPTQRRYEALRAYFVEELAAAEVAARFGYSPAVVHQMASELRAGRPSSSSTASPARSAQARASGFATGCSRCARLITRSARSPRR